MVAPSALHDAEHQFASTSPAGCISAQLNPESEDKYNLPPHIPATKILPSALAHKQSPHDE